MKKSVVIPMLSVFFLGVSLQLSSTASADEVAATPTQSQSVSPPTQEVSTTVESKVAPQVTASAPVVSSVSPPASSSSASVPVTESKEAIPNQEPVTNQTNAPTTEETKTSQNQNSTTEPVEPEQPVTQPTTPSAEVKPTQPVTPAPEKEQAVQPVAPVSEERQSSTREPSSSEPASSSNPQVSQTETDKKPQEASLAASKKQNPIRLSITKTTQGIRLTARLDWDPKVYKGTYKVYSRQGKRVTSGDFSIKAKQESRDIVLKTFANGNYFTVVEGLTGSQDGNQTFRGTIGFAVKQGAYSKNVAVPKEYVTGVKKIQAVNLTIKAATSPKLPSKLQVTWIDGRVTNETISWAKADYSNKSQKVKTLTLTGSIANTTAKAVATIKIHAITKLAPLTLTVKSGTLPSLPTTVKATWTDGSSSQEKVTWTKQSLATYTSDKHKTVKVTGSLVRSSLKANLTVTVKVITKISTPSLTTLTKMAPQLPSEVTVTWSDKSTSKEKVKWNQLTAASYTTSKDKTIQLTGRFTNLKTSRKPTVAIKVLASIPTDAMHRLFNPNSGEHFYTANTSERDHLVKVGWKSEGIGWYAPKTMGVSVYRLYNPNAGDHHYTTNAGEKDALVHVGWKYEGIGWKSYGTVPLYRLYNPNAKAGSHHYTTNKSESNHLVTLGWKYEGVAWYGVEVKTTPKPAPSVTYADAASLAYERLLEEYFLAFDHREDSKNNLSYMMAQYFDKTEYGYYDLDRNGVKELILRRTDFTRYDVYTYSQGKVVHLTKDMNHYGGGVRNLYTDGTAEMTSWDGFGSSFYDFFQVKGDKTVKIASYSSYISDYKKGTTKTVNNGPSKLSKNQMESSLKSKTSISNKVTWRNLKDGYVPAGYRKVNLSGNTWASADDAINFYENYLIKTYGEINSFYARKLWTVTSNSGNTIVLRWSNISGAGGSYTKLSKQANVIEMINYGGANSYPNIAEIPEYISRTTYAKVSDNQLKTKVTSAASTEFKGYSQQEVEAARLWLYLNDQDPFTGGFYYNSHVFPKGTKVIAGNYSTSVAYPTATRKIGTTFVIPGRHINYTSLGDGRVIIYNPEDASFFINNGGYKFSTAAAKSIVEDAKTILVPKGDPQKVAKILSIMKRENRAR